MPVTSAARFGTAIENRSHRDRRANFSGGISLGIAVFIFSRSYLRVSIENYWLGRVASRKRGAVIERNWLTND
jgi:hypothetical protein